MYIQLSIKLWKILITHDFDMGNSQQYLFVNRIMRIIITHEFDIVNIG